jgi:hypothetical protein
MTRLSGPEVRTNTCPVFSFAGADAAEGRRNWGKACGPKPVRSGLTREDRTSSRCRMSGVLKLRCNSRGGEPPGRWAGEGADRQSLRGPVTQGFTQRRRMPAPYTAASWRADSNGWAIASNGRGMGFASIDQRLLTHSVVDRGHGCFELHFGPVRLWDRPR